MALLQQLEQTFKGFSQDVSRDQLSNGVLCRYADFIPDLGAPARKRGGWVYQGDALHSTGTYVSGLGYFRKTTGVTEQVISVDDRGVVFKDGARVGSLTAHNPVAHNPFYFLGNLILIESSKTAYNAKRWTGTQLLASKSSFKVGCSWGDFIVWGNTVADATLVSFGITTTTTISGSTVNMPGEVVALAGMPGRQVLVFGYSDTWALIGDNPPPGGNMVQRTLYAGNGIMDQRSLVNTGAYVIWANTSGIFQSSGTESVPLDLTQRGGISTFWRDLVKDFDLSAGWCAAATKFKDYYIISVTDNNRNPIITLMLDVNDVRWTELQNVSARALMTAPGASFSAEEAYFGRTQEPRVARLSTLWTPGSADLAYDGDGTAVLPYMETGFYRTAGYAQDRIRNILVSYDLSSTVGSATANVSFVTSPDDKDYTPSGRTLPITNGQDRKYADIRRRARGVGLKVELASAANDLRIFALETEGHTVFEKR